MMLSRRCPSASRDSGMKCMPESSGPLCAWTAVIASTGRGSSMPAAPQIPHIYERSAAADRSASSSE